MLYVRGVVIGSQKVAAPSEQIASLANEELKFCSEGFAASHLLKSFLLMMIINGPIRLARGVQVHSVQTQSLIDF